MNDSLVVNIKGRYGFRIVAYHFDKYGNFLGKVSTHNIVTTEGDNALLDVIFGSDSAPSVYCFLFSSDSTPADTWTYAGIGTDFTEFTGYSETTRPAFQAGSASGGSIDNSSNKATFSITSTATIYGAGLIFNVDTKGDNAGAGVLYCAGRFSSSKNVASGDTINLQYTCTSTDDGA